MKMLDHGNHGNALRATRKEAGGREVLRSIRPRFRHIFFDLQDLASERHEIFPHHNLRFPPTAFYRYGNELD